MFGWYVFTYMGSDTVIQTGAAANSEVMAAVEDGPRETFVLADISKDDAFVTMALDDAASLPAWR